MKFKTLKYTLILSTILSSGIASAQKVDEPRAIALSNAMIQMFATTHLNKPDAQIKMTALIQNVSEEDIQRESTEFIYLCFPNSEYVCNFRRTIWRN